MMGFSSVTSEYESGLLPGPKAEFSGLFDGLFDLLNGPNEVNKICFYTSFYVLDRTGPLN